MHTTILLILVLLASFAKTSYTHNGKLALAYPLEGINIDGDLSDWPNDGIRYPILYQEDGDSLRGPGDFKGEFRIGYNVQDNVLYVGVEIEDDLVVRSVWSHQEEHSDYSQEVCTIYLSTNHQVGDVTPERFHIWLRDDSLAVSDLDEGSIEVRTKWDDSTYVIEWRINIKAISNDLIHLHPELVMGFDVEIWDEDGDNIFSLMAWGRGTGKDRRSSKLGDLILSSEEMEEIKLIQIVEGILPTIYIHKKVEIRIFLALFSIYILGPLALISSFLKVFEKSKKENYSFVGLFFFSSCFATVIPAELYGGPDLDGVFWIIAIYFSLLQIFLILSKFHPGFHTFRSIKTRSIGIIPSRWQGKWSRKIPIVIAAFIMSISFIISIGLGDANITLVTVPIISFVVTIVFYQVEKYKKHITLRSLFYFSIILVLFLQEQYGILTLLIQLEHKNWLALIVVLSTLWLPYYLINRKVEGRWLLSIGSGGFTLCFIYQVLSIEGFLPSADLIYIIGFNWLAITMAIWVLRNFNQTRSEERRRKKELEEARKLQLSMLPLSAPSLLHLDISWYMETATEVGGDYYDYVLAKDGTLTITLGDATGHGLQAGTVVTASKSLFQSLANNPDIIETFSVMSRSLKGMHLERIGMAMCMVKVKDHKLQISSAGIPPVLVYQAATQEIEEILLAGVPLGFSTSFQYRQRELDLHPGDTILMMSDGLPERLNNEVQEFGYPRTEALFKEVANRSPEEICEYLARGGEEWANGRPQDDDVTFVVLKVKE